MVGLRFFCFGNFELFLDAASLPKPATLKAQSLLAYLLGHRQRPLPREQLMTLFWGERPSHRARRSLSTALWHIRRCLSQDDLIQADNRTVQWQGNFWLDVAEFERLAESDEMADLETAAALYRGDFLEGFYDEWVIDERYQLHGRLLEVLARLISLYEAHEQPQPTLATALRLLAQDPLQESAHRAAMRAYAHLGQRNAALEQFQQCRTVISVELDVEPMPETQALYEQIRDGRFSPAPSSISYPPTPLPTRPGIPKPSRPGTPFVGRTQELAFLQQQWQTKLHSLLLISGEAGIGKTRLLQEFTGQLPNNQLAGHYSPPAILHGRCYEFERLLPYQPFAEAIGPLVTTLSAADWAQLPAWVLTEMTRLLPDLLDYLPDPKLAELPPDRTRLLSAIGRLLTTLAVQRPLLLILEDLHWATESTLHLLHFLVRQLARQPILLVGTFRQEQVGSAHPLTAVQRQLSRENLTQTLTLSRLGVDEVTELVEKMVGEGETVVTLAQRLYTETEGNPFYLMETLQTLFETQTITPETGQRDWQTADLPLAPGIMAAIEARVQRLTPSAQEAVRLASVLGREFDFDLLNAVWGQGEEQTLAALDDLLRFRLIAEGTGALGRDYAFTHHKIQEAVYASLPGPRRQRSHARVASLMEVHYPPAEVASELGFHYQQGRLADAGLTPKAVAYLQLAGEQAAAQYAHEEAIGYFSQALEMLAGGDVARIPLLLAREKALDNLGNRAAQAQDLTELAELVQQLPADVPESVEQQTAVALRRSNFDIVTGDYASAVTTAQTALNMSATAEAQIELACAWALALFHQGEYEAAIAQIQQVIALAPKAELHHLEAKGLNVMAMIAWRQGRYEAAKRCLQKVLAVCQRPGYHDLNNEGNALGNLGIIYRYQSDFDGAESYFRQSLAIWRQTGYRRGEALYLINLGVVAFDTADYAAAHQYFQQALTISQEIGDRENEQAVLSNLSAQAIFVAKFDEAARLAEQSLAICWEIGNRTWEGIAYTNLGVIACELGQFDEAVQYYEQSLKIRQERGDRRGQGMVWRGLGEVAWYRQDLAAAQHYCEQAVAVLHEIGDQAEEGLALNTLAKVEMDNGRYAAAQSHISILTDENLLFKHTLNNR